MRNDSGLIVSMKIRIWTARRTDRRAALKVEEVMGAEREVGTYTKSLVEGQAVRDMNACVKRARRALQEITLPWGDEGERLLPVDCWGKFEEIAHTAKAEFEGQVSIFMDAYEESRRNARRRFGGMFNEKDYPAPDWVRRKFKFEIDYTNIPEQGDIRVDLEPEQIAEIEKQVLSQAAERTSRAMANVFYRLHDAITTLHNQLDDEGQTIRRNTVDHVQKLLDLLPALNITEDKVLDKAIKRLADSVGTATPNDISSDVRHRRSLAKTTEQVLGQLRKHSDKKYPDWTEGDPKMAFAVGGDADG